MAGVRLETDQNLFVREIMSWGNICPAATMADFIAENIILSNELSDETIEIVGKIVADYYSSDKQKLPPLNRAQLHRFLSHRELYPEDLQLILGLAFQAFIKKHCEEHRIKPNTIFNPHDDMMYPAAFALLAQHLKVNIEFFIKVDDDIKPFKTIAAETPGIASVEEYKDFNSINNSSQQRTQLNILYKGAGGRASAQVGHFSRLMTNEANFHKLQALDNELIQSIPDAKIETQFPTQHNRLVMVRNDVFRAENSAFKDVVREFISDAVADHPAQKVEHKEVPLSPKENKAERETKTESDGEKYLSFLFELAATTDNNPEGIRAVFSKYPNESKITYKAYDANAIQARHQFIAQLKKLSEDPSTSDTIKLKVLALTAKDHAILKSLATGIAGENIARIAEEHLNLLAIDKEKQIIESINQLSYSEANFALITSLATRNLYKEIKTNLKKARAILGDAVLHIEILGNFKHLPNIFKAAQKKEEAFLAKLKPLDLGPPIYDDKEDEKYDAPHSPVAIPKMAPPPAPPLAPPFVAPLPSPKPAPKVEEKKQPPVQDEKKPAPFGKDFLQEIKNGKKLRHIAPEQKVATHHSAPKADEIAKQYLKNKHAAIKREFAKDEAWLNRPALEKEIELERRLKKASEDYLTLSGQKTAAELKAEAVAAREEEQKQAEQEQKQREAKERQAEAVVNKMDKQTLSVAELQLLKFAFETNILCEADTIVKTDIDSTEQYTLKRNVARLRRELHEAQPHSKSLKVDSAAQVENNVREVEQRLAQISQINCSYILTTAGFHTNSSEQLIKFNNQPTNHFNQTLIAPVVKQKMEVIDKQAAQNLDSAKHLVLTIDQELIEISRLYNEAKQSADIEYKKALARITFIDERLKNASAELREEIVTQFENERVFLENHIVTSFKNLNLIANHLIKAKEKSNEANLALEIAQKTNDEINTKVLAAKAFHAHVFQNEDPRVRDIDLTEALINDYVTITSDAALAQLNNSLINIDVLIFDNIQELRGNLKKTISNDLEKNGNSYYTSHEKNVDALCNQLTEIILNLDHLENINPAIFADRLFSSFYHTNRLDILADLRIILPLKPAELIANRMVAIKNKISATHAITFVERNDLHHISPYPERKNDIANAFILLYSELEKAADNSDAFPNELALRNILYAAVSPNLSIDSINEIFKKAGIEGNFTAFAHAISRMHQKQSAYLALQKRKEAKPALELKATLPSASPFEISFDDDEKKAESDRAITKNFINHSVEAAILELDSKFTPPPGYQERCDVFLMATPNDQKDVLKSDLNHLYLYRDVNNEIFYRGQIDDIDPTTNEIKIKKIPLENIDTTHPRVHSEQRVPLSTTIKLLNFIGLPDNPIKFTQENLVEQILAITSNRGHTHPSTANAIKALANFLEEKYDKEKKPFRNSKQLEEFIIDTISKHETRVALTNHLMEYFNPLDESCSTFVKEMVAVHEQRKKANDAFLDKAIDAAIEKLKPNENMLAYNHARCAENSKRAFENLKPALKKLVEKRKFQPPYSSVHEFSKILRNAAIFADTGYFTKIGMPIDQASTQFVTDIKKVRDDFISSVEDREKLVVDAIVDIVNNNLLAEDLYPNNNYSNLLKSSFDILRHHLIDLAKKNDGNPFNSKQQLVAFLQRVHDAEQQDKTEMLQNIGLPPRIIENFNFQWGDAAEDKINARNKFVNDAINAAAFAESKLNLQPYATHDVEVAAAFELLRDQLKILSIDHFGNPFDSIANLTAFLNQAYRYNSPINISTLLIDAGINGETAQRFSTAVTNIKNNIDNAIRRNSESERVVYNALSILQNNPGNISNDFKQLRNHLWPKHKAALAALANHADFQAANEAARELLLANFLPTLFDANTPLQKAQIKALLNAKGVVGDNSENLAQAIAELNFIENRARQIQNHLARITDQHRQINDILADTTRLLTEVKASAALSPSKAKEAEIQKIETAVTQITELLKQAADKKTLAQNALDTIQKQRDHFTFGEQLRSVETAAQNTLVSDAEEHQRNARLASIRAGQSVPDSNDCRLPADWQRLYQFIYDRQIVRNVARYPHLEEYNTLRQTVGPLREDETARLDEYKAQFDLQPRAKAMFDIWTQYDNLQKLIKMPSEENQNAFNSLREAIGAIEKIKAEINREFLSSGPEFNNPLLVHPHLNYGDLSPSAKKWLKDMEANFSGLQAEMRDILARGKNKQPTKSRMFSRDYVQYTDKEKHLFAHWLKQPDTVLAVSAQLRPGQSVLIDAPKDSNNYYRGYPVSPADNLRHPVFYEHVAPDRYDLVVRELSRTTTNPGVQQGLSDKSLLLSFLQNQVLYGRTPLPPHLSTGVPLTPVELKNLVNSLPEVLTIDKVKLFLDTKVAWLPGLLKNRSNTNITNNFFEYMHTERTEQHEDCRLPKREIFENAALIINTTISRGIFPAVVDLNRSKNPDFLHAMRILIALKPELKEIIKIPSITLAPLSRVEIARARAQNYQDFVINYKSPKNVIADANQAADLMQKEAQRDFTPRMGA